MATMHVFIVDYAYGFKPGTCEVDYVCMRRCQAALRALKRYPKAHIVLAANMKEQTQECGPLADMMETFLIQEGVPVSRIYRNAVGHDTLSETEGAYEVIKKHGGGHVVCATSFAHSFRVSVIWFCRFGIVPELYVTKLHMTLRERLYELIKIPCDMLRAFWSTLVHTS